jgi:hypothetical protein
LEEQKEEREQKEEDGWMDEWIGLERMRKYGGCVVE